MKSLIKLQQYRKCIMMFVIGIVCTTLAFIVHMVDPVKRIMEHEVKMTPNSYTFALWKKPPIDVLINVYVFNITNAEVFLSGAEKLKLKEVGPYVYQEILENTNVTWNENGTLSYIPRRTVIFRRDLSAGDPNQDYVSVPNLPLLGVSSALKNAGFLVNFPFVQLANYLDSQPILHITAQNYFWGYDDSLVRLASTVVPSYIHFSKFGLLDRMYDEGANVFNMISEPNGDLVTETGRYLSVDSINGNPGMEQWGYISEAHNKTNPANRKCNMLRGVYEGTVFPTHMDKRAQFRIYRKAFCRPLPINFVKETTKFGLSGYEYTLPDNFADRPDTNPDNECYCRHGECMKKGLLDMTPCYFNIPAAASLPHFLNGDPSLSNGIEGLKPDPEKHRTEIILQPDIGIPIYVRSRMQTNLVMGETRYNAKIKHFNNMTVPLFWTDVVIPGLPDDILFLMKFSINVAPIIQQIIVILLAIIGLALICWSLVRVVVIVQEEQEEAIVASKERRDSNDPRVPLGYGQYTAIHILPAIKKMSSKVDLFSS
ncbi:scavenger receptor class B member 1 [Phymastichus coffea]|uniref:scavenger receptor class B member 1 n=1 Tax=Phymastichus coffea TaxID=108790 RepID=UPI00273A9E74|nr:scavenger receptor class B member 1 [Phymastichus coffea]